MKGLGCDSYPTPEGQAECEAYSKEILARKYTSKEITPKVRATNPEYQSKAAASIGLTTKASNGGYAETTLGDKTFTSGTPNNTDGMARYRNESSARRSEIENNGGFTNKQLEQLRRLGLKK